jgi:hypothetical protein
MVGQEDDTVFVLYRSQNGNLVIGTKELIFMPKSFPAASFDNQLKKLKDFQNSKCEIAF